MTKYRVSILLLAKSLLLLAKSFSSLIALVVFMVVIHESAHFITALIMQVPIASFAWFVPRYFGPAVFLGSEEYTLGAKVVGYSGGLVTGLIFLLILVLKRKWFRLSLYRWFLGSALATFGFLEVWHGILEGAFYDMYIADITNIFGLGYVIGYALVFLGAISYCLLMPNVKGLIAKEGNK